MIDLAHVRPPWVPAAITELREMEQLLGDQRDKMSEIALLMKAGGANTGELSDAAHELEHAEKHLTAARRCLEMTWPERQ